MGNCLLAAEQLGSASDGGQKLEGGLLSLLIFHFSLNSVSLGNYTCVIGKLHVCRWATQRGVFLDALAPFACA